MTPNSAKTAPKQRQNSAPPVGSDTRVTPAVAMHARARPLHTNDLRHANKGHVILCAAYPPSMCALSMAHAAHHTPHAVPVVASGTQRGANGTAVRLGLRGVATVGSVETARPQYYGIGSGIICTCLECMRAYGPGFAFSLGGARAAAGLARPCCCPELS